MPNMPALSILMPCYNRDYDLPRVLAAYEEQNSQIAFELIAVDDASVDTTNQLLTSYRPRRFTLRVERQASNQGPAAARNRGIALATAPLIVFVGDDILPEPDFVQGHLDAHQRHPDPWVAILGRVLWADEVPQNTLMTHIDGIGAQQFSYRYFKDGAQYDFRHFYTANISLKKALLLSLDRWFDTDFPYPAFEDAELGYRLTQRGLRIIYDAAIRVRHTHYHTVWSFSARQYNAGLMAWMITRKHPVGVGRVLYRQFLRLLGLLRRPRTFLRPDPPDAIRHMEDRILRGVSFYEWMPQDFLDQLYVRVLDYFYYKGIIDGIFGKSHFAARLHGAHARQVLVPLLNAFSNSV